LLAVEEVDQTTLLVEVLVVDLQAQVAAMLLVEVARVEHNLQVVVLDLFHLLEQRDLHFKEDLVPVVEVVDTSAVAEVEDIMVVVLMVLAEVVLLILDHHF
tara:strand:- start:320 stop:622 length:303 start_codon:yes stop_codon:yes gene_type:complete